MANPDNGHPVRFGIITDIHFSTGNETAAAHLAAADLRNCIEGWKRKKIGLLLQLGDLIQGSEAHKQEEFSGRHPPCHRQSLPGPASRGTDGSSRTAQSLLLIYPAGVSFYCA